LGRGTGSLAGRRGCLSRRGYSIYTKPEGQQFYERWGQGRERTQTPSSAARAGSAGKPAAARPDTGVVGNTAVVVVAALPLQLAVACSIQVSSNIIGTEMLTTEPGEAGQKVNSND
jgi:hypothetical protein